MREAGQPERAGAEPRDGASERFGPLPSARARGRVVLSSSTSAELAGLASAAGLAFASTYVVARSASPVWLWLPVVALASGVWAIAARARRAELSWDEWGITLDERGERTAIAWSCARAYVTTLPQRTTVQVSDDEGRVITVHQGRPPGLSIAPRRAADLGGLLAAIADLPKAAALLPERDGVPVPFAVAGVAVIGLGFVYFVLAGRPLVALAELFVGGMSFFALHEAVRASLRAWALRGARAMRVTGAVPGPLRAELSEEPVVLRVAETLADGRLGERGEPVLVALGSEASHEAPSPYRDARVVAARALETVGERASRRRRLASGLARFAVGVGTIASWVVLVPPPEVPPPKATEIRTLSPPPEPPRPRPIAPRPEGEREADERLVEAWRARGPHFEREHRCHPRGGCETVTVYVDPRSGTRIVCEGEQLGDCMHYAATGGLPLPPSLDASERARPQPGRTKAARSDSTSPRTAQPSR